MNCPHAADMVYTLKERRYYEQIERAYDFASKLLLELLMKEKELLARIRWGHFPCRIFTQSAMSLWTSSPHQVGTVSVSQAVPIRWGQFLCHMCTLCAVSLWTSSPPCKIFSLVSQTMEQSAVKFGGSVVKDVAPGFESFFVFNSVIDL